MVRYYKLIGCLLLLIMVSCKRQELMENLVGTWSITEIKYVQNGAVNTTYPVELMMKFTFTQYETFDNGILTESGTFLVNVSASTVQFFYGEDTYKFKVLENEEDYQHWKRDVASIGLTVEFKMDKIQ